MQKRSNNSKSKPYICLRSHVHAYKVLGLCGGELKHTRLIFTKTASLKLQWGVCQNSRTSMWTYSAIL